MFHKKKPADVFIPRSATVNDKIYIPRPTIEKQLIRAVESAPNIIIKGESGCGKSWLYKKVFKQENIKYEIIDLSEAAIPGMSIEKVISNKLNLGKDYIEKTYQETASTEGSVALLKGGLGTETGFVRRFAPLEEMYKALSTKNKTSILVLDNLEHISNNQELLTELNSMIMKIDNVDFAKYNVKLMIVGTPFGVTKFYKQLENISTISNRLSEIPEVKGLDKTQTNQFLENTLRNELQINFSDTDFNNYCNHIFEVTNGVPQNLHEYCLNLCYVIEDHNDSTDYSLSEDVDISYLRGSFQKNIEIISRHMNSYDTSVQRRNQVIYTVGYLNSMIFRTSQVEAKLRELFHINANTPINISNVLSDLSPDQDPLLIKNGDTWMLYDGQYPLTIRLMLKKVGDKVIKVIDNA